MNTDKAGFFHVVAEIRADLATINQSVNETHDVITDISRILDTHPERSK